MKRDTFSKHLSIPETICVVRECLDSIPQPTVSRGATQSDCLLSGLAVFSLKILSWLKFDELFRLNEGTERARNYYAQVTTQLPQRRSIRFDHQSLI